MILRISTRWRTPLTRVAISFCLIVFGQQIAQAGATPHPVMTDVGGYRLSSVHDAPGPRADLPPIVFIHGASANLYDPVLSFRDKLLGRAELLFVDRPGHGGSDVGPRRNMFPDGQADAIAALMDKRGIRKAIIVSHSFGGAVAAAFALNHPDKVLGLVFLSPAVYPWPGGIAWYYDAARVPVSGWLFSTFVAPPAGLFAIDKATRSVFAPNSPPPHYVAKTHAFEAIAPAAFHHNAVEVGNLLTWTKAFSPGYGRIRAPVVIITGDADEVVSPQIHARHLARDIKGATLISVHNLGHKSDYIASDLAIAAMETVAGRRRNLGRIARSIEAKIAPDHGD